MSSFTTPLSVTPLSDGRRWRLTRSFTYHIGSKASRRYIRVPRGFETDFASVPKFLWFLPYWAKYSKAPVLHDWIYEQQEMTRTEADKIFLEAMMVDWRKHRSRYAVAYIEYIAVRLFGSLMW